MKTIFLLVVLALLALVAPNAAEAQTAAPVESFTQVLYKATALVYHQDEDGNLQFICTATAFEKTDVGYWLSTAKHCIEGNEEDTYFVVFNEDAEKPYIKAKLLFEAPDADAAVLGIITVENIPIIRLGDEKLEVLGAPVVNMASPLGLGKLFFRGSIVARKLAKREQSKSDTPDPMVLELPAAGGSSGSAIVSESQQAIIGILVQVYPVPNRGGIIITTAVPVSQLRQAIADFKAGKKKPTKEKPPVILNLFPTKH